MSNEMALWLALGPAIAAILYGIWAARWILAQPAGNEKMQSIAAAVQEGAKAYMNRQYSTIGIVGVVLFVAVGFLLDWATAIGFAIGIGLQKIGSNLVSGMMLLISKPLRLGDVITFEKGFAGASWGWITQMDLMYVHVATRNGSLLLVPNEVFLTQKIENLSYDNNRVRLIIPFAIAYDSDLVKAKTLADSICVGVPRNRVKAWRYVAASQGAFLAVSDEAITGASMRRAPPSAASSGGSPA